MKARAHVIFYGLVQGVFFRDNTKRRAYELGVKGWIRNRWDGSVEAIFEGDEADVMEIIEWCRTKQPHARVTDVKIEWQEFKGEFHEFEVGR